MMSAQPSRSAGNQGPLSLRDILAETYPSRSSTPNTERYATSSMVATAASTHEDRIPDEGSIPDDDTDSTPPLSQSSTVSESSMHSADLRSGPKPSLLFDPQTNEAYPDQEANELMTSAGSWEPALHANIGVGCIFRFNGCQHTAGDVRSWYDHSRTHFDSLGIYPPERAVCQACSVIRSEGDPQKAWYQACQHMWTEHLGNSDRPTLLGDKKTDEIFVDYLWRKRVINDADKKELMKNPVGPLEQKPVTISARRRERMSTREGGMRCLVTRRS